MIFLLLPVLLPMLVGVAIWQLVVCSWAGRAMLAVAAVGFAAWVIEGAWKLVRPRRR